MKARLTGVPVQEPVILVHWTPEDDLRVQMLSPVACHPSTGNTDVLQLMGTNLLANAIHQLFV
jgi:hypothetical protein